MSNKNTFLLEFCFIAVVKECFIKFFKDKSKSIFQDNIESERLRVHIQVKSISVNPKKSQNTGKSINICSNNIRKTFCIKKSVSGSYQGNFMYRKTE